MFVSVSILNMLNCVIEIIEYGWDEEDFFCNFALSFK